MRFSLAPAIAIILANLTVSGSAFKIDTFHGQNCDENQFVQHVDIWDNTCAKWPTGFESFKILNWGSPGQRAEFLNTKDCHSWFGHYRVGAGRVDPSSQDFKLNTCYNFARAQTCNSIESHKDKIFS